MVIYREHAPPPEFADTVECLWVSRGDGPAQSHRVLPDGCLDLLGGKERGAFRGYLIGAMTAYRDFPYTAQPRVAGIRFLPGQAARHLAMPLGGFGDSRAEMDGLLGSGAKRLIACLERCAEEGDEAALWSELRTLVGKGSDATPIQRAAAWAAHSGPVSVEQLSGTVWLGTRQFRRRFLDEIGLTPKHYLRVLRMRRAMAVLRKDDVRSLADLALHLGFYDQAHLTNEIRVLTGKPPSAWRPAAGLHR